MPFHYLSIAGDESVPKASEVYTGFRFLCVTPLKVCVYMCAQISVSPPSLCTVICIGAAHHYLKVSINQSPLLFIVSPCTVQRLLNKKTFLYEEGRRGEEKKKKMQLYSLDLKMF